MNKNKIFTELGFTLHDVDVSIKDSFFGSFIHSELGEYRLYFKFKTNIVCIKVKMNLYRMKDLIHFSRNHSMEKN